MVCRIQNAGIIFSYLVATCRATYRGGGLERWRSTVELVVGRAGVPMGAINPLRTLKACSTRA